MRLSSLCQIECLHKSGKRVPACVPAQRTQHCLATSLESKACKTTHRNKATMAFQHRRQNHRCRPDAWLSSCLPHVALTGAKMSPQGMVELTACIGLSPVIFDAVVAGRACGVLALDVAAPRLGAIDALAVAHCSVALRTCAVQNARPVIESVGRGFHRRLCESSLASGSGAGSGSGQQLKLGISGLYGITDRVAATACWQLAGGVRVHSEHAQQAWLTVS